MTDGPSDTFAAFVDALSDALDDHAVTAADLAARVRLSRFHFDRVIASTAGEPPARFRRRVLLERAAFRLVTSDATILDIAVEAGYSSHEAFTRAFARAYGVSPKRWRREPSRFAIASPNGVHFHPPGSLRLPGREKVRSMDLLVRMVEHHVWLVGQMLDRAGRLTADQLDTPVEISVEGIDDDPTLRSLLSRLVGQLDMWSSAIENREYDFSVERGESVQHMQRRLAEVGPSFIAEVRDACEAGRLGDALLCPGGDGVEIYTFGGMIAHVLTFAAHRRTLVAGALADAGFDDLDSGDPIHWVAESAG
ncbi:helix-turn-helix domain-containing protein [Microlunatus parietis]|uniref:AraC-like DNA-binding protein n=1 Tax=Microlunatus parietis TaxID=682979 RepID=A0A7Y9IEA7_9ACTN|nr:AraC family transcriptional regulator [Microlunatus parietis]NYE75021.1 AraC-like DNA-binding protein [Microlunatus parietis]